LAVLKKLLEVQGETVKSRSYFDWKNKEVGPSKVAQQAKNGSLLDYFYVQLSPRWNQGSFFLHLQNFFYTSKLSLNFPKTLWPADTTPPKLCRLPEIKIYDFRKSKYITESRFSEVKIYHWKSTSKSQNISPEVDFQK